MSFEQAATLPVAGLTALRSLENGGFVVGKRVLVTGASGGVGRFAIQLAKLAGAHVTAVARRTGGLAELGADEVAQELRAGGSRFRRGPRCRRRPGARDGAAPRRAAGGTVINFAATTPEPVAYPDPGAVRPRPGRQAVRPVHLRRAGPHPQRQRRPAPARGPCRRGQARPADRHDGLVARGDEPRSRRCWTGASTARRCSVVD